MSAMWKAEIDSLTRLVVNKENERTAEAVQSARWSHRPKRAAHLHIATDRAAKRNKDIVFDCIKAAKQPLSANKISELTGLTDTTTRKHLVALEDEGLIQAVTTPKRQKRYFLEKQ